MRHVIFFGFGILGGFSYFCGLLLLFGDGVSIDAVILLLSGALLVFNSYTEIKKPNKNFAQMRADAKIKYREFKDILTQFRDALRQARALWHEIRNDDEDPDQ